MSNSEVHFDPRNILVIDFGQLGDVVMSLPALWAIRQRFPLARITVAAGRPAADIVRLSGYGDDVLEVDRVSLRDGSKLLSIARILKFVARVRKQKFDFVIDLHSFSETNLLGFLSGAPQRLYAHRPGRSLDYLSNFRPRAPREAKASHQLDRYLDVVKPLGITNVPRRPQLKTDPIADSHIEAILKREKVNSGSLLVGLFPGAGNIKRLWPLPRFAELADYLVRNDRVRILVFTGPEEAGSIPQMRPLFPASTIFFDRLTISQLASAQARLTLFVSNDTGPPHIAAATGTPVIVILGEPTLHQYVPVGDQHRIICAASINDITVDQIYNVAHELLSSNRTERLFSYSEAH